MPFDLQPAPDGRRGGGGHRHRAWVVHKRTAISAFTFTLTVPAAYVHVRHKSVGSLRSRLCAIARY